MYKKSIAQILMVTILMQSCVGYQKVPVSIQQTIGKGEVKVEFDTGKKTKFKYIKLVDGEYFGVRKGYSKEHLWKIDGSNSSFYLLDNPYKVWIRLYDNTKIKGVLFEVGDSSIWVADSDKVNVSNDGNYSDRIGKALEYSISDIQSISVRSSGKLGRGAGKGAIIGLALGSLWFLAADGWIGLAAFMMGITGVAGALFGTLFSTNKENFDIYGSHEKYKSYQEKLHRYSIN